MSTCTQYQITFVLIATWLCKVTQLRLQIHQTAPKKVHAQKNIQEDEQAKGFKLKLHLDQLSLPRKALAMHWHVRTTSSSVHY